MFSANQDIYAALLAGDEVTLRFANAEEKLGFLQSYAVFFSRQNKKLRNLGMAKEYKDFIMTSKDNGDGTITFKYAVKKYKYPFEVVSIVTPSQDEEGNKAS